MDKRRVTCLFGKSDRNTELIMLEVGEYLSYVTIYVKSVKLKILVRFGAMHVTAQ